MLFKCLSIAGESVASARDESKISCCQWMESVLLVSELGAGALGPRFAFIKTRLDSALGHNEVF